MKKVKLADVLWDAANKRLTPPSGWESGTDCYSCNAAMWAEMPEAFVNAGNLTPLRKKSKTNAFLKKLGCPVHSMYAFEAHAGGSIQGIRYMWLLLAMHVAEDEGIEIEVNA